MRRALPRAFRCVRTRLQEFLLHRVGREILIPFHFLGCIALGNNFATPGRFRHSISPLFPELPHGRSRFRGATWSYPAPSLVSLILRLLRSFGCSSTEFD